MKPKNKSNWIRKTRKKSKLLLQFPITNNKNSMAKVRKNGITQTIPLFIQKLTSILQDQSCAQYIEWTSSGDAFNIKDVNRFTDVVLPKYFKHNNYSSFIRQLNMYGFNKVRHDEGDNVYMNQHFKKDSKELLGNIKRKINQMEREDRVAIYNPQQNNLGRQLQDLKTKQKNLESMCRQLIDQNNRILEENNMMMKRLSAEQKEKNSKMEQLLVSLIMARGNNQLALPSNQQSRMLSLTNETKPDYGANFEAFRQFLEDSNGISRLQEALKKYQSEEKKRNKSKNFTIVNQVQNQTIKPQRSPLGMENRSNKSSAKNKSEDHDNSMLSLGDFFNLDENTPNSHQQTLI